MYIRVILRTGAFTMNSRDFSKQFQAFPMQIAEGQVQGSEKEVQFIESTHYPFFNQNNKHEFFTSIEYTKTHNARTKKQDKIE